MTETGFRILVDADACPVKDEVVRVAARRGSRVVLVSNAWMRGPDHPLVERVLVASGPDAADDRIAEDSRPGDIVVTSDLPLAARCLESCLEKGAAVLRPNGKPVDSNSIGMAVAVRDLAAHLREMGEITGGRRPSPPATVRGSWTPWRPRSRRLNAAGQAPEVDFARDITHISHYLPHADNISRYARRCTGPKNNAKKGRSGSDQIPHRFLRSSQFPSRRLRAQGLETPNGVTASRLAPRFPRLHDICLND
jgi:uncharacterized protein YaiI (UPF0178 family)